MADHIAWQEGENGKGVIDQTGEVYAWNDDEFEMHDDFLADHPHVNPTAYFYIDQDGGVEFTMPNPNYGEHEAHAQAMGRVLEADPSFHDKPSGWRF